MKNGKNVLRYRERCCVWMNTIEVDCRKCKNCTGTSCKKYGSNADKAVTHCAKDCFKNYKQK